MRFRLLLIAPVIAGLTFTAGHALGGTFGDTPVGLGVAASDTAYVNVTGDTMTNTLVFSGVTTDLSTASGETLTLDPGGTAVTAIVGGLTEDGQEVHNTFDPADNTYPSAMDWHNCPAAAADDDLAFSLEDNGTDRIAMSCDGHLFFNAPASRLSLGMESTTFVVEDPAGNNLLAVANTGAVTTFGAILSGLGGASGVTCGPLSASGTATLSGNIKFNDSTGSVSTNAVTCSATICTITDDGTDIAAGATRAAITWTNTLITSTSVVHCNMGSTPDANTMINAAVVPGSGTAQLYLANGGSGAFTSAGLKMFCTVFNPD